MIEINNAESTINIAIPQNVNLSDRSNFYLKGSVISQPVDLDGSTSFVTERTWTKLGRRQCSKPAMCLVCRPSHKGSGFCSYIRQWREKCPGHQQTIKTIVDGNEIFTVLFRDSQTASLNIIGSFKSVPLAITKLLKEEPVGECNLNHD